MGFFFIGSRVQVHIKSTSGLFFCLICNSLTVELFPLDCVCSPFILISTSCMHIWVNLHVCLQYTHAVCVCEGKRDMCDLIFTPHTPLPSPPCGAGSCCATFMQMNCMSHPRNSCMWQHEDESKQLEETVCPSRMILIVRAVKTSYFNIFSTSVMLFDFHLGSIGGEGGWRKRQWWHAVLGMGRIIKVCQSLFIL